MDSTQILITSGPNTVAFNSLDGKNVAQEIKEAITRNFVVGDVFPTLAYEDDEGDTINLNIEVPVEVQEALRVQLPSGTVKFRLLEPLKPRSRPALIPPTAVETPVEDTTECLQDEVVVDEEVVADEEVVEEVVPEQTLELPTKTTKTTPAATMEDLDAVMAQVQSVMQGFTNSVQEREDTLKQQLDVATAETAQARAKSASLKHALTAAQAQVVATEEKLQAAQRRAATEAHSHTVRISELTTTLTEVRSCQAKADRELSMQKSTVEQLRTACSTLEEQRRDLATKLASVQAEFANEKQTLCDQIAAKREEVSTHQLRVTDLEAENAALRKKMQTVYNFMTTFVGSGKLDTAFQSVKTGVTNIAETVGAVCVAAKQEVTEAVKHTHNYKKKASKKTKAKAKATKKTASPPSPSPFIKAMDSHTTTQPQRVFRKAVHQAHTAITNIGLNKSLEEVEKLMIKHKDNLDAIVNEMLGN